MSEPIRALENYLERVTNRLRWRQVFRFLLAAAGVSVLLTVTATVVAVDRGVTPLNTLLIRGLWLLLLCGLAWLLLVRPLRRLGKDRGGPVIESTDPVVDGRVTTYIDTARRDPDQALLPLLAEDANTTLRDLPPERVVPSATIAMPMLLLASLVGVSAFLWQGLAENWRNTAAHWWYGWLDRTLVVERAIEVAPGNVSLVAGDELEILASLAGFQQDQVTLEARVGDGQWQSLELAADEAGQFHYLHHAVESFEYRIDAGVIKSDTFRVDVQRPPSITAISARIEYPEWTRLETREITDAGSLSAVRDSRATITFTLDGEADDVHVVIDELPRPLEMVNGEYRFEHVFESDTSYRIFTRLLDREIPLSRPFDLAVQGDTAPDVRFSYPGRDISASPIEEVPVVIEASDDFAIEAVELVYSVNAGPWQTVALAASEENEHRFMLESMGTPETETGTETGAKAGTETETRTETEAQALEPGDLVTYYARARDHASVSETDMMMIDVRPFVRRYNDARNAGGGGGAAGGGADEGSEISKRQKEILLATWNLEKLTRDVDADTRERHRDNANLLAESQRRLAEQARTLATRSEARDLVGEDDNIRKFVDYLRRAADVMEPSASALEKLAFARAVQPQQQALQLLQRAEALFADISIVQNQGQGNGARAGEDMAEMFELEMDLESNRYEQPDRGEKQAQAGGTDVDELADRIAELAHRAQELEEERQTRAERKPPPEERWRRRQLERDIAELQDDIEAMREALRESERNGADGEGSDERRALEQAMNEALEQLEQARRELEQSEQQLADASRMDGQSVENHREGDANGTGERNADQENENDGNEQDQSEKSEAASGENASGESTTGEPSNSDKDNGERADSENGNGQETGNQDGNRTDSALQNALNTLQGFRADELERALAELAERASALVDQQRDSEARLREIAERQQMQQKRGMLFEPLEAATIDALTAAKSAMARELRAQREEAQNLLKRFGDEAPVIGSTLGDALAELDKDGIEALVAQAADNIAAYRIDLIVPVEARVTNGIRNWRDRLLDLVDAAGAQGLVGNRAQEKQLSDAREQIRNLRELIEQGQQSQQNQQDREGQQGEQGQQSQQNQEGQQG